MLHQCRHEPSQTKTIGWGGCTALDREDLERSFFVEANERIQIASFLLGAWITNEEIGSTDFPQHLRMTVLQDQDRELKAAELIVTDIQNGRPEAHQIANSRELKQSKAVLSRTTELLLQDAAEDILAKGEIEVAGQHAQA